MVVKKLRAFLAPPPPREKKKLAPKRFCSWCSRATVRATVDFPVPAIPLSQKTLLKTGLLGDITDVEDISINNSGIVFVLLTTYSVTISMQCVEDMLTHRVSPSSHSAVMLK